MDGDPRLPRAASFDYWLCRCRGFSVSSPGGAVGLVEEVRFRSRLDRPDAIAVRAGLVGSRLLIVPVEAVTEIVARERRVVLRSPPPVKGQLRLWRLAAGRRRDGRGQTPPSGAARRLRQRLSSALGGRGRADQATEPATGFAAEMLSEARALLARGWCQFDNALDEDSDPVDPTSASARSWSASGALLAVWEQWRSAGKPAELVSRGYAEATLALKAIAGDIAPWNDTPERTHEQVLAAFDHAIELLLSRRS